MISSTSAARLLGLTALALAVLSLALAFAFVVRGGDRGGRPAAPTSPVVVPAPLRCANGDPPREWTQAEAEARYHNAAMYLRSAEAAGLWNDTGRRAAMIAVGQLLEVVLCRP